MFKSVVNKSNPESNQFRSPAVLPKPQIIVPESVHTIDDNTANMSAKPINRVTLFKIPSKEDQAKMIDMYRTMPERALKDGKPYILSVSVGPTFDDARNQGYTFAAHSVFASVEDMKYYDDECAAHAELKKFAREAHQGVMMVYFQNAL
jgi:hypothetical protein